MTEPANDTLLLIDACIRRQPAAQKELVRRYAGALLSVARRYARSHAEAEDILQDAFMLIFNKIKTFMPEKGPLHAWMRKIVINTALAHYRKFHFDFEQPTQTLPDTVESAPEVFSKLNYDEILELINDLPVGAREVFNMAVFDEFSHDEIGAALNIPAGTSRYLLSKARKILQEKILKLQENELARI
jgi:RNA polymerase sigma factor (sigma-70 family)